MLRRADIVHYHALGPAALAPLARLAGLPVVVTVHGLDWQRAKWGTLAKRCIQFGERMAAANARKIIGVSPILIRYFAENYGVDATFIPNGVMPMQHRPPERMLQYGIEPRKFLFSVSRLVPEKGLHYLIPAFESLDTDFKLVIAGGEGFDADYEQRLREMAGDRVVFLGPADRDFVAELFSHAQLFVLPSDLEGMSIALLEAMNMGVPVLVSDIPENVCVVKNAGFTFRAGDIGHLRDVLGGIIHDAAQLSEFGRRASERVAPFQWPVVVDQLEQTYFDCCGKKPVATSDVAEAENPLQTATDALDALSIQEG